MARWGTMVLGVVAGGLVLDGLQPAAPGHEEGRGREAGAALTRMARSCQERTETITTDLNRLLAILTGENRKRTGP